MKNLKSYLLIISLFILTSNSFSRNNIVLNSTRTGGFLGMYSSVSQTYIGQGYDSGGVHWYGYNLNCSGGGFNRCRIQSISNPGLTPELSALYNFALSFVNEMEDDIEDEVDFGNLTGTLSQSIARDLDGDGVYDKLVTITGTWNSLDADFNEGSSTITIDEIDYPY